MEDFNRLVNKDNAVTRETILEGTEHISLAIKDLTEAIKIIQDFQLKIMYQKGFKK